ncbi:MAG: pyruvate kinase [Chromatiales bacterium]|nr:pyruvate kinase [Chromatiales bacterium]
MSPPSGPATDDPKVLDKLIEAGVDVVRLNFSHDLAEEHMKRAETGARAGRARTAAQVGVLVDLQGPKIRIGKFKDGPIDAGRGRHVHPRHRLPARPGQQGARRHRPTRRCSTTSAAAPRCCSTTAASCCGSTRCRAREVICRVVRRRRALQQQGHQPPGRRAVGGGADRQGPRGHRRPRPRMEADYVAISFPRSAADVERGARRCCARPAATAASSPRSSAPRRSKAIEEIIEAADVHHGGARRPGRGDRRRRGAAAAEAHHQAGARDATRSSITATQMMESMIESADPDPRRGLRRRQRGARRHRRGDAVGRDRRGQAPGRGGRRHGPRLHGGREAGRGRCYRSAALAHQHVERVDEAIAHGDHVSPPIISRSRRSPPSRNPGPLRCGCRASVSRVPIYALTRQVETRRKVTLYRGVYPVSFEQSRPRIARLLNREADGRAAPPRHGARRRSGHHHQGRA